MIVCKNRCVTGYDNATVRKAFIDKIIKGASLYELGLKYCIRCERWYNTVNIRCICCNGKLRFKPRAAKAKQKFEAKGLIKRIDVTEDEGQ